MFNDSSNRSFMQAFDAGERRQKRAQERFSLRKKSREEYFQKKRRQMNLSLQQQTVTAEMPPQSPSTPPMEPSRRVIQPPVDQIDINNKRELLKILSNWRVMTAEEDVPRLLLDSICGEHLALMVSIHQKYNEAPPKSHIEDDILLNLGWVMTNIASGDECHSAAVVSSGGLEELIKSLEIVQAQHINAQMLWGIANIAGDCEIDVFRRIVLDRRVINTLTKYIRMCMEPPSYEKKASRFSDYTWMLVNMCRHSCTIFETDEHDDILRTITRTLCAVVSNEKDHHIQADAIHGLGYLLECNGANDRSAAADELYVEKVLSAGVQDILHRLVQYCDPDYNKERGLRMASLSALGHIAAENNSGPQLLLTYGLVETLKKLLTHDHLNTRKTTTWIMSNLVLCGAEVLDYLHACQVFDILTDSCVNDPESSVRKESAWSLANACISSNHAQIERMVANGLFPALVHVFSQEPKEDLFQTILEAVYTVLHVGECLNVTENAFSNSAEECLLYEVLEKIQATCSEGMYQKIEILLDKFARVNGETAGTSSPTFGGRPQSDFIAPRFSSDGSHFSFVPSLPKGPRVTPVAAAGFRF